MCKSAHQLVSAPVLTRPSSQDGLLFPLTLLRTPEQIASLAVMPIDAAAMPEPYRGLLAHDSDMTPTLERHFAEPVILRPITMRRNVDLVDREVALVGERTGRVLEIGVIRIDLTTLPANAASEVRVGRLPLGDILARHSVKHTSRPLAFLRLTADAPMVEVMGLPPDRAGVELFGRRNRLIAADGRVIAQVIEILPPTGAGGQAL